MESLHEEINLVNVHVLNIFRLNKHNNNKYMKISVVWCMHILNVALHIMDKKVKKKAPDVWKTCTGLKLKQLSQRTLSKIQEIGVKSCLFNYLLNASTLKLMWITLRGE